MLESEPSGDNLSVFVKHNIADVLLTADTVVLASFTFDFD